VTIVYVVNVGANSGHASVARSPVFDDGGFVFVSFPTKRAERTQAYAGSARSYVRNVERHRTHADPDWVRLTYGDYCDNPRAGALKRASQGDILLFWGLLWTNIGSDWAGFTGERDWYLFGALRIAEVLRGGEPVTRLSESARVRAALNAHLEGDEQLREGHQVFVGDLEHSMLFRRAVALDVSNPNGLLYRAFTAASGESLSLHGRPAWQSSLRACRPMWDLGQAKERSRAEIVADAISASNDFDLLRET
jgi:hypothetical protein